MNLRIHYVVIATVFLYSCGDSTDDRSMQTGSNAAATTSGDATGNSVASDRQSFVLCPALEDHRDELASIVGFEQNPERALAMSARSKNCVIRGKDGGFIGVEIPPAFVKSVELHATESYDGTASQAPAVSDDAVFVETISQPHLIFSMGPILIDVNAEYYADKPDRDTMVELAMRVRDILLEAN